MSLNVLKTVEMREKTVNFQLTRTLNKW